ncbi:mannose-1-phosphate guanylyltransferase [Cytophaga sp. FL35]|uniref:mannose-1-phosphate guanylyltransferase n=1 Tax=Cytophaga sp. FL35 TaxID=1904456 RepID=UPI00165390C9|nr:mannose-1-phosphate guanylyltransferase [Cytophaga sp. FL35]MBC6998509.1 mannose-1-phosphate guanylyltransferase [Cytophaga sp. FL35]
MNKNYYAVLMAGGVGSRFWPISTSSYPKQFHDMLGTGDTLIQKTFKRLNRFVPTENILILTNERYNDLVLEQLPMVEQSQVVLEPAMRNTAPCILYAALKIQKMNPDGVMIVAPSDHWIEDEEAFAKDVTTCFEKCEKEEVLCTLGIKPSFPNTGFGYIEFDKNSGEGLKKVHQFREKPDYETAKEFLAQGNFLWNAGIFMWSVETIVNAFEKYQPQQFELFDSGMSCYNTPEEREYIKENYPKAENISIDYAILENSKSIYVLPATFDWNDLGTWGSLYDKLDKDTSNNAVVNSQVLAQDASGNMIRSPKDKVVVVDGLKDYIIVDKEEVLLIYPKEKEQDIKKVLAKVKDTFGDSYA